MQRLPCHQAEAGVVPRAAYGVVDHQPFRERAPVMGAGGTDREECVTATRKQNRMLADVP